MTGGYKALEAVTGSLQRTTESDKGLQGFRGG